MSAQIMSGTAVAEGILADVTVRAADLTNHGVRPMLATVLVGDDPSSAIYVAMKRRRCAQVGIESRHVPLPATITTAGLVSVIRELSADPTVHGILLQHPVPAHIDGRAAFEAITPDKDVDGVTLASFAAMAFARPGFPSCTPAGIMRLLDAYGVDPAGKHAVVVGCGPILGKPMGMMLLAREATVTYCHARTADLVGAIGAADILIAACGVPNLIKAADLRPGVIVVDAGYHPGGIGDVDPDGLAERAGLLTPVPGGVGPMTIAMLMEQTVNAAERR
ncbi:MAG TPA: bifunctional 5,10-methylenetetrahydrofolate dehydrogenase/5,10-methenyltetrahydrofolate cyclohydrolase, partial [Micromonosporaceae bacterium]